MQEPQPAKPKPSNTTAAKPSPKESIWDVYYPRRIDGDQPAVLVASFPMIVYFWPSLFVFLVCGLLQAAGTSPTALGWCATASLLFNLLVIVTDLNQKKFAIALLATFAGGLLVYIAHQKEWGIVSSTGGWIAGLELTYSTDVYMLVTAALWMFMAIGLMQPRFNYWRFEPNEFTHYIQPWGRDQSVPRAGSTVSREIPDVLEMLLTFGGGSLVVKREGQVVVRIKNVPFLGRRMQALEQLLGVTRVKHIES